MTVGDKSDDSDDNDLKMSSEEKKSGRLYTSSLSLTRTFRARVREQGTGVSEAESAL
jgi:hypothetical protein